MFITHRTEKMLENTAKNSENGQVHGHVRERRSLVERNGKSEAASVLWSNA